MKIKVIGTIVHVGAITGGESKNGYWEKQEVVVETGVSDYGEKEKVAVTFFGEKTMTNPKVGEFCMLECILKCNEYNGKFFNNITLWKWERTAPVSADDLEVDDDDLNDWSGLDGLLSDGDGVDGKGIPC